MSEPKSTGVAKALESTLADIRTARGYFTDLGLSVHRGFYAHALESRNASFPLVAIQPTTEGVPSDRKSASRIESFLQVVIITNDTEYPADILRACLADVRRALALKLPEEIQTLGMGTPPEIGTAEFAIAADSNFTLAVLPVGFTFVEKYEA